MFPLCNLKVRGFILARSECFCSHAGLFGVCQAEHVWPRLRGVHPVLHPRHLPLPTSALVARFRFRARLNLTRFVSRALAAAESGHGGLAAGFRAALLQVRGHSDALVLHPQLHPAHHEGAGRLKRSGFDPQCRQLVFFSSNRRNRRTMCATSVSATFSSV